MERELASCTLGVCTTLFAPSFTAVAMHAGTFESRRVDLVGDLPSGQHQVDHSAFVQKVLVFSH